MDTDVGKWAIAISKDQKEEADKIREKLFAQGHFAPVEYLMSMEKALAEKVRTELKDSMEGKEYLSELEKNNYSLVGVMVAYEFSLLDLYEE